MLFQLSETLVVTIGLVFLVLKTSSIPISDSTNIIIAACALYAAFQGIKQLTISREQDELLFIDKYLNFFRNEIIQNNENLWEEVKETEGKEYFTGNFTDKLTFTEIIINEDTGKIRVDNYEDQLPLLKDQAIKLGKIFQDKDRGDKMFKLSVNLLNKLEQLAIMIKLAKLENHEAFIAIKKPLVELVKMNISVLTALIVLRGNHYRELIALFNLWAKKV